MEETNARRIWSFIANHSTTFTSQPTPPPTFDHISTTKPANCYWNSAVNPKTWPHTYPQLPSSSMNLAVVPPQGCHTNSSLVLSPCSMTISTAIATSIHSEPCCAVDNHVVLPTATHHDRASTLTPFCYNLL